MDSKPYADTGVVLKTHRIAARITQRELSKRTGIPLGTIQGYEQGRLLPTTVNAFRLVRTLSIPYERFAETLPDPQAGPLRAEFAGAAS